MSSLLRPFLDRWRLCSLIVSAAMLAIAHAFETFGHMSPCELCLKQRTVYWVAGGLAFAFMLLVRAPGGARWRELTCWVLGLAFLASFGAAAYHAGVEWKFWPGPQSCTGTGTVSLQSLKDLLNNKVQDFVRCDRPAWIFLGLSMAGWNAVISAGLVALSVSAALRERAKA